jgi:hypothetical protein
MGIFSGHEPVHRESGSGGDTDGAPATAADRGTQVRTPLAAGGRWIRTSGSAREEIEKSWYPVGVQLILYGSPARGTDGSLTRRWRETD